MGKATQDLRAEHNTILHVLKIMGNMTSADNRRETNIKLQHGAELINFLTIFADKCHHGKEEIYLFKALIKKGICKDGGLIEMLIQEHNLGKKQIGMMNKSLESRDLPKFNSAAGEYIDLLKLHIKKENNEMFVIADRILDNATQDELFQKFEYHEESVIGHGVHEKFHSMIQSWSEEYEKTSYNRHGKLN